ncbi:hypothetical protein CN138_12920 [Sinorhizobium meliloti]|uniref:hypothetical protein n=1 Tax=Rhizobium meliloti TaxID=382 RepID=UPI000FD1CC3C|nr:hypothetical protein [Sinorhizobium meliloti]RVK12978.1 hypothetical protein CN164_11205 [Sinorhizobium meliloti]RVL53371.1 hypothetical protein CN145_09400 [Sinorhizobium meliloti]RVL71184.1 hypothetical protein CN138_12920 [Sinorhizobium meliloti]RVM27753.1 hypothetical protein CN130_23755 [Sinorhizobium meliloti]RVP62729.1 hypothetical protein CN076_05650 [Sinorhizobium meliloti]
MSDERRLSSAGTNVKLNVAKIVYETCIVTFIDILGFRDIVAKSSAAEISAMLTLLRKTTEISEVPQARSEVDYYAFSDSIVRVRRISNSVVETIGVEANDIGLAQLDLAHRGVLIRGGLTVGQVYSDGRSIFGPAMIRAYDLESKDAISPRVLIDPQVVQSAGISKLIASKKIAGLIGNMLSEPLSDGVVIDYLSVALDELDEDADVLEMLKRHKEVIEAGLIATSGVERVRAKYEWLFRYHNRFVMKTFSLLDARSLLVEKGLTRDERDKLLEAKFSWSKEVNSGSHDFDDDQSDYEDNGDRDDDSHPQMLDFLYPQRW